MNDRNAWGTPQVLFDNLNKRFGPFTLDVAADASNAKCERHYSIEHDGLIQPWDATHVWCNPPYDNIEPWVAKAVSEVGERGMAGAVAMLLPARVGRPWFARAMMSGLASVYFFVDPRINFVPPPGVKPSSPTGSHLLLHFSRCRDSFVIRGFLDRDGNPIVSP